MRTHKRSCVAQFCAETERNSKKREIEMIPETHFRQGVFFFVPYRHLKTNQNLQHSQSKGRRRKPQMKWKIFESRHHRCHRCRCPLVAHGVSRCSHAARARVCLVWKFVCVRLRESAVEVWGRFRRGNIQCRGDSGLDIIVCMYVCVYVYMCVCVYACL